MLEWARFQGWEVIRPAGAGLLCVDMRDNWPGMLPAHGEISKVGPTDAVPSQNKDKSGEQQQQLLRVYPPSLSLPSSDLRRPSPPRSMWRNHEARRGIVAVHGKVLRRVE